jgi:predicted lipoprotein with Yx(FWY)xxD motif
MNLRAGIAGVLAALLATAAVADDVMPAGVGTQKTAYGDVLADAHKMTLYAFDQDKAGKSACTGPCADVRVPLAAPRVAHPAGDWTIVTRDDGSKQWAYKGQPLYGFTGDHAPGDLNGVGGDWKAVMVNSAFMPAGVAIKTTDYGPTFTTSDGRTLYMEVSFFYNAGANGTPRHQSSPPPSACAGECAQTWTPLIAPAEAKPAGDWTTVMRDDGKPQWAWKGHPLFLYARDAKPGDTTGEGHWTLIGNVGTHWEVANIVL